MPSVSIIVPCYNEQETIPKLLEAVYGQTFPRHELELIIADGLSSDGTRQCINEFSKAHPDLQITLIDNPARIIPAALNCAVEKARGEYILRLDAHSMPYPDYIERSISDLSSGLGANVGGVWEILPGAQTWIARSIAVAAGHPLGVGDAMYRRAGNAAAVDTVPFGAFKRSMIADIGLFDETLLTNEDYEFNSRIRRSGGRVWLDPAIRSVYFSRRDLSSLARQYWRYGFWKWRMLRRYPETIRWRQALPPLFVFSLLVGMALAFFFPAFGLLILGELIVYILILFSAAAVAAVQKKAISLFVGLPLAIATMHFSWGTGFLWSMIKNFPEKSRNSGFRMDAK